MIFQARGPIGATIAKNCCEWDDDDVKHQLMGSYQTWLMIIADFRQSHVRQLRSGRSKWTFSGEVRRGFQTFSDEVDIISRVRRYSTTQSVDGDDVKHQLMGSYQTWLMIIADFRQSHVRQLRCSETVLFVSCGVTVTCHFAVVASWRLALRVG